MKRVLLFACLAMLPLSYAAAEGYQVNVQSTKQSGMGHVGAAMKLGAESMHFNPAGLGFLDKQIDLSVGAAGVFSKASYTTLDGAKKFNSDNDPSTPLYAYAGFKIYDNLSAGISLNTPYGSAMNWGKNWAGAHLVQDISLKAFSLQPTLSYRPFDRLSIGAGMMVMFGNFSLSRALFSSGDMADLAAMVPQLAPLAEKYKDITPVYAELSGDAGIKLGFNVGAMFDVNDQLTVGVSYRSKVNMEVGEGTAKIVYANEAEIKQIPGLQIPPLDMGYLNAQLPLPSNFNVGATYKPNDKWLFSGELQFVGWGAYKSLNVKFYPEKDLGKYNISAPKNYENTIIYRAGAQYALTERFDLRLGAYFDESPVKSDFLNPETPSMDKLGLTTGFSFRPAEAFSIDFAFNYVTGFGRTGSYTDKATLTQQPRKFEGEYDVHAFTVALGLAYTF
ncbi:OmpP1/FadL family transporter [Massilibacteroides vaginae]|uniref:OmpP1/FadL family transporter n=1 Tax=Massilibacteroides vaginae TaxID=1673718 RepID=UPI000A1CA4FF|nr:outer membrane protein transport protein [Massilibacteroides vaginae]